jgi:hypothetical protein
MVVNIADVNLLVEPYLHDDLKLISKWIKDDLFVICKFLYDEKDLEGPEGKIHIMFEKQCKERLSGWKAAINDDMKQQFYAKIVLEAAKKNNLFASGFNLRRSGIYTVMLNRFVGKWWL